MILTFIDIIAFYFPESQVLLLIDIYLFNMLTFLVKNNPLTSKVDTTHLGLTIPVKILIPVFQNFQFMKPEYHY